MKNMNRFISVALILCMITIGTTVSMADTLNVELGTIDDFAVVAASTITNTGTTTIDGDVGLHPGTAFSGQASVTVNGDIYINNAVALQAKNDLTTAYNDAAGRAPNTIASELGGRTLIPGVYSSASTFQITGTLILDGQNNPDAVFIFQLGSALTTASGSNIELINGANFNNIYWQVGSSATLGTNSEFSGNILATESITAATGASIEGRLLAMTGAVTLDNNIITNIATGSLTVTKSVFGDISNITLPAFEIMITGPDGFTASRVFLNNESFTWDELTPGIYNVTESRVGLNSEWTVSGEAAVQVFFDQIQQVTINNSYTQTLPEIPTEGPADNTPIESSPIDSAPVAPIYGSLTVRKLVMGDTTDIILPSFEITVTGPNNFSETRNFVESESFTWLNLVPGVYNVVENSDTTNSDWTVVGEGQVTVIGNQVVMATIINDFGRAESGAVETTEAPVPTEATEPVEPTEPAEPTESTEPAEPIIPVIPQTGQDSDYKMTIYLGGLAILFAALGVFLEKRKIKYDA